MSNSDTTPSRISQRSTKGIRPARFENYIVEMPDSQPQKPAPPQGNANTSQAKTHRNAGSSLRPTNAQHQPSAQSPAQLPPISESQNLSSRSNERQPVTSEIVSEIARDFDKKIADMRNEFQRQMHAMQELMISNAQQVNNSVIELRNERRRENMNAIQQVPVSQSPVNSESSNASIDQRQKKIYPLPAFTGFIESFRTTTSEFNYSNLQI